MVSLCNVCIAKRDGTAVPKRKCTCESGDTQHRNRKTTRKRVENLVEFELDNDPYEHLFNLEEYEQGLVMKSEDGKIILQIGEPNPDALDFHDFQNAFWKALGDLSR